MNVVEWGDPLKNNNSNHTFPMIVNRHTLLQMDGSGGDYEEQQ